MKTGHTRLAAHPFWRPDIFVSVGEKRVRVQLRRRRVFIFWGAVFAADDFLFVSVIFSTISFRIYLWLICLSEFCSEL